MNIYNSDQSEISDDIDFPSDKPLPLDICLSKLKKKFKGGEVHTNNSDKYWNLTNNGFVHFQRLIDGFNPSLSRLQQVELQYVLEDVGNDMQLGREEWSPQRLILLANWLIGISNQAILLDLQKNTNANNVQKVADETGKKVDELGV